MKSKIFILFSFTLLVLTSSYSTAQELRKLSQEHTEVQADVLKNIAQQADTKAELYRGPKTTVLQLDTALQQIKLQLMEIENELSDKDDKIPLDRFETDSSKAFNLPFLHFHYPM